MNLPEWWPHDKPYAIMDCLEGMRQLPDKCVDLVLTDPPYNLGREYDGDYDDKRPDYEDWCRRWFSECKRLSRGPVVFSIGTKNLPMWYSIETPGWLYCWFKGNNMGSGSTYTNIGVWEPFLIYGKVKKRMGVDGAYVPIAPQKDADGHDCPKSLKLIEKLLLELTDESDIVLDCFLGSGTTLQACRKNKRIGIGFEISSNYEPIIRRRSLQDIKPLEGYF